MEFLFYIAIRSVLLAAVAGFGLWICRVKSAQVRHAVWTFVTAGMLAQVVLNPLLPALPLRVLRPVAVVQVVETFDEPVVAGRAGHSSGSQRPDRLRINVVGWGYSIGVAWWLAQLGYAWWFTRRLVRESVPLGGDRYESRRISVPVTVGRRILLPVGWREWDGETLRAVIAHEAAHVARRDWAVAAMARVNRCVFWFHPQAWWLERTLSRLAEDACDDAALGVVGDPKKYARVLMEMAQAAGARGGRVAGAVAMAKEAKVEMRINRILDAGRRVPKALGRVGWSGLLAGGAVIVYLAAAVQLAPAQGKQDVRPVTIEATPTPATPAVVPAQRLRPRSRQLAQAAPPPLPTGDGFVSIPKVYNGTNKTFYFLSFPQRPDARVLGRMEGIVRDPSGARVPNAMVTVLNAGGVPVASSSTGALGGWSVPVPVGLYSLQVVKEGFVMERRERVLATPEGGETIDMNLQVATNSEVVTVSAEGTPRPPSAAGQNETDIKIGGKVQPGRRVRVVQPNYPQSAKDQGVTGAVVIQALIGKSGKVLRATVVNDAPGQLKDAALAAVQQWEYTPALLNGEPVDTMTTVTVNFQLDPQ